MKSKLPEQKLTDLKIPTDFREDNYVQVDHGGDCKPESCRVYFRDLSDALCGYIREADVVVGAVAWLTEESVLRSLSQVKHGVGIVVQKEDFLRPDHVVGPTKHWAKRLRVLYDAVPNSLERGMFPGIVGGLSTSYDGSFSAIRCVGNHNRDRNPAFPRMHNKFLVFCHCDVKPATGEYQDYSDWTITPYAVWTGSFNFTKNGTLSFENAVYLVGDDVAGMYYNEWSQIFALSEPLDWKTDWCNPEYRIGT